MQPFMLILAIGAVILSCSPRFSANALGSYSIHYTTQDGVIKSLPNKVGICQDLPNEAYSVINTTPDEIAVYPHPGCQGQPSFVPPGKQHPGAPQFLSTEML